MRRPLFFTSGLLLCILLLGTTGCPDPASEVEPGMTDTDGDGLADKDEFEKYGTSPLLADTDGDGYSDFEEVVEFGFDPDNNPYRFNPRLADVPSIGVEITSPPAISV